MLTNHNSAMFMKIEPWQNDVYVWKLNVNVSKLYNCNATNSSFHAVLFVLQKSTVAEHLSSFLGDAFRDVRSSRLRVPETLSHTTSRSGHLTRRQTGSTLRNRSQNGSTQGSSSERGFLVIPILSLPRLFLLTELNVQLYILSKSTWLLKLCMSHSISQKSFVIGWKLLST